MHPYSLACSSKAPWNHTCRLLLLASASAACLGSSPLLSASPLLLLVTCCSIALSRASTSCREGVCDKQCAQIKGAQENSALHFAPRGKFGDSMSSGELFGILTFKGSKSVCIHGHQICAVHVQQTNLVPSKSAAALAGVYYKRSRFHVKFCNCQVESVLLVMWSSFTPGHVCL